MSDMVLGAIIGISGTIFGALIAGISSYTIARQQINARRDELNQQQKHNERQTLIDRLVKARENVLIPLREILSKWIEFAKQDQQMLVRLEKAYERVKKANTKDNTTELERELQLSKEVSEKSTQVTSELAIYQGQISDFTLDQKIEAAKNAHWETARERVMLDQLFNNPQTIDTKALENKVKEYHSILNNLRGYLISANKRIEELLSGEPSS